SERAQDEEEAARRETQKTRAELERIRAAVVEEVDEMRALTTAEIEEVRKAASLEVEQARAAASAELEAARKSATEAEEVAAMRIGATHVANQRKIAEAVDRALNDNYRVELFRATRLSESIRTLDEANGLSDVLTRLAQCAGDEVDRVAVLIAKGSRLMGWQLAGFGNDT